MVFRKGLKMPFLTVCHPKKKWQTKCELMEVSPTLSMALGMTGKNLMKDTAATLKTLQSRQTLLDAFFLQKCCDGAHAKIFF